MALEIRKLGDPVLREKCRDVEAVGSEVSKLMDAMGETLAGEPGRVGLAASQLGVLKRLFVYDVGYGTRCLINPRIIEADSERMVEEGCLSVPGIYVPVPRFDRVRLFCTTLSGHRIIIEACGFMAQVFQHECDHLDGVLIIDRCSDDDRRQALQAYQEMELQREQAGV